MVATNRETERSCVLRSKYSARFPSWSPSLVLAASSFDNQFSSSILLFTITARLLLLALSFIRVAEKTTDSEASMGVHARCLTRSAQNAAWQWIVSYQIVPGSALPQSRESSHNTVDLPTSTSFLPDYLLDNLNMFKSSSTACDLLRHVAFSY